LQCKKNNLKTDAQLLSQETTEKLSLQAGEGDRRKRRMKAQREDPKQAGRADTKAAGSGGEVSPA
jgi:hypothetical protein